MQAAIGVGLPFLSDSVAILGTATADDATVASMPLTEWPENAVDIPLVSASKKSLDTPNSS
jgi:hypothetical protein